MSEWTKGLGSDVRVGDRVRLATGIELVVSTIEDSFMGRPTMMALIEDTPDRWFKQPVLYDAEVEIRRPT